MNTANDVSISRGEVFYITSKFDTVGSEQRSGRPAVVVSNRLNNEHSECVEICYLTLQEKKELPTHVKVTSGACINSTVLCEQITTISKERIGDYMCRLSDDIMDKVDKALLVSLDLEYLLSKVPAQVNSPAPVSSDSSDEVSKLKEDYSAILSEVEVLRVRAEKAEVYERMYNELLDKILRR